MTTEQKNLIAELEAIEITETIDQTAVKVGDFVVVKTEDNDYRGIVTFINVASNKLIIKASYSEEIIVTQVSNIINAM